MLVSTYTGGKKMKACVNEECILCGLCADMCPDIFRLGEEKARVVVNEIPSEQMDCCREAADSCPVEAIEVSE